MKPKKQSLASLCAEGITLIACTGDHPGRKLREIESVLSTAKIACASTRWMEPSCVIEHAQRFIAHTQRLEPLVILIQVPFLSSGWRLPIDRVIWTDEKPATTNSFFSAYRQYPARGEVPSVDMLHYPGAIT